MKLPRFSTGTLSLARLREWMDSIGKRVKLKNRVYCTDVKSGRCFCHSRKNWILRDVRVFSLKLIVVILDDTKGNEFWFEDGDLVGASIEVVEET